MATLLPCMRGAAFGLAAVIAAGVPRADAGQTIWFQQPLATLDQNFTVVQSPEVAQNPKPGSFTVTQWQPDPRINHHFDVPVTWDMVSYTGVSVPRPRSHSQAGVVNRIGSTAVQIYQDVVGVNLNSLDFSRTGTTGNLVSIMPSYEFPDLTYMPFAQPGTTMVLSSDLQVVSASVTPPAGSTNYGGQAYVALDMRFVDTTHPASPPITVSTSVFNVHGAAAENIGYTGEGGGRILVRSTISAASQFTTIVPDTTAFQNTVWTGFRPFSTSVTAANFSAGLQAVQADSALLTGLGLTSASFSSNPADYALVEVHVNCELNYAGSAPYVGGSVQMGLSVRNMMAALQ